MTGFNFNAMMILWLRHNFEVIDFTDNIYIRVIQKFAFKDFTDKDQRNLNL